MSTTAIIMLVLFVIIIWGGLIVSAIALRKSPDERTGIFGSSPYATDTILIGQELDRSTTA